MASFRDLRAWQLAHDLAVDVHRFCDTRWSPSRAAGFDQLRRAALSVSLNIAEGYASGPGARCKYLLRVAHGSAVETTVLLDFFVRTGEQVAPLLEVAERSAALTYRLWAKSRGGPSR